MWLWNRHSSLAQWRVTWLIEHSTSHQLLWCIDSFVLRNPPLRQAPKRCGRNPLRYFRPHRFGGFHRMMCSPLRGLRTSCDFAKYTFFGSKASRKGTSQSRRTVGRNFIQQIWWKINLRLFYFFFLLYYFLKILSFGKWQKMEMKVIF